MSVIVVYNPSDPQVANKVTEFNPSAHGPDYSGESNKLTNPDIGTLWTIGGGYIVPLKYWKYDGVGDIVEMSQAEKDAVDQLVPEVQLFNSSATGSGPTAPLDASVQVERGAAANASFKWDESLQTWCIGLFGQEIQVADVDMVPTNITDLGDVRDPMNPADGDLLAWNNANSEWENKTPTHDIAVKNEGVAVTGSPFNTLNLIGTAVNATDGGSGEVDITITAPTTSMDDLTDADTTTTTPNVGDHLEWDGSNWVPAAPSTPSMRPTFAIWAEENSAVTVSANNYEYSFGNGAVNTTADPPGIPMGVNCTLIGIGVSARNNNSGNTSSVSISVTRNGTVVATGGIASGSGTDTKIQDHTDITPDTVNFAPGDTLQFLTATETGTLDDVRVVAWFERTS